ncbi:MAG: hypothetical protein ABIK11_01070 [candidate division WOR-3 bacterium]
MRINVLRVILLFALLAGCDRWQPFEKLKGPEYFPPLGQWIYQVYETRDPNFRWSYSRVQEHWERMRYENNSGKEVEIDVIQTLNFYPGSSGSWYTYFYVDASGVYEYNGFEFYPTLLFPVEPGKGWVVEQVTFIDANGVTTDTRLEAQTSLDTVRVPAGEFKAVKVELNFYDYTYWLVYKQKQLYWKLVRWFAEGYGIVREYDSYIPKYKDLESVNLFEETGGGK